MTRFNPLNFHSCNGRLLTMPNVKEIGEKKRRGTFLFASKKSFRNADGQYESNVLPIVVWNKDIDFIEKNFMVGQHCHLMTEVDSFKRDSFIQLQLVMSSLSANETKAAVKERQQRGEKMATPNFDDLDSYFSSEYGVQE